MGIRRTFVIGICTCCLLLMISPLTFGETKKGASVSISGMIEQIQEDYKFVVINEQRVLVSPETPVTDERGNPLKVRNLKRKDFVGIEAQRTANGFIAKKVVLKKPKGVLPKYPTSRVTPSSGGPNK